MKTDVKKLFALIMVIIMGTASITTSAALGWEVLPITGEEDVFEEDDGYLHVYEEPDEDIEYEERYDPRDDESMNFLLGDSGDN